MGNQTHVSSLREATVLPIELHPRPDRFIVGRTSGLPPGSSAPADERLTVAAAPLTPLTDRPRAGRRPRAYPARHCVTPASGSHASACVAVRARSPPAFSPWFSRLTDAGNPDALRYAHRRGHAARRSPTATRYVDSGHPGRRAAGVDPRWRCRQPTRPAGALNARPRRFQQCLHPADTQWPRRRHGYPLSEDCLYLCRHLDPATRCDGAAPVIRSGSHGGAAGHRHAATAQARLATARRPSAAPLAWCWCRSASPARPSAIAHPALTRENADGGPPRQHGLMDGRGAALGAAQHPTPSVAIRGASRSSAGPAQPRVLALMDHAGGCSLFHRDLAVRLWPQQLFAPAAVAPDDGTPPTTGRRVAARRRHTTVTRRCCAACSLAPGRCRPISQMTSANFRRSTARCCEDLWSAFSPPAEGARAAADRRQRPERLADTAGDEEAADNASKDSRPRAAGRNPDRTFRHRRP